MMIYIKYISITKIAILEVFVFPCWLSGKESSANAGNVGSIPRSGRSPGEAYGNLSSILAWEILQIEEPGKLQSMGSQKSQIPLRAEHALRYPLQKFKQNLKVVFKQEPRLSTEGSPHLNERRLSRIMDTFFMIEQPQGWQLSCFSLSIHPFSVYLPFCTFNYLVSSNIAHFHISSHSEFLILNNFCDFFILT